MPNNLPSVASTVESLATLEAKRNYLYTLRTQLQTCERSLGVVIALTPTGDERNRLTEVNIDVLGAVLKVTNIIRSLP